MEGMDGWKRRVEGAKRMSGAIMSGEMGEEEGRCGWR